MRRRNMPVIPLPNVGEGGPVFNPNENMPGMPVIPLPNPGEGGPVVDEGDVMPEIPQTPITPAIPIPPPEENVPAVPVIPLPNPGEGGAVDGGNKPQRPVFPGIGILPIIINPARVRFLNAAYGYKPFKIMINNRRVVDVLNFAAVSDYGRIPAGYKTITVMGKDGYVYIQKTLPFQSNSNSTVAIINTPSGLDLLQIPDNCCIPRNNTSNFRVSNLAINTRPMDVLLGDGRAVFADVTYKETTSYKKIEPGDYQFLFAETNIMPLPDNMGIETLDSAFIGMYPLPDILASLYLKIEPNANYTVFILSGGTAVNAVQTLVLRDK